MKKGTLITVRSASSRLPGKCYKLINGKEVIRHIIERAKQIKNSDEIVVCTTNNGEDDKLCEIASELEVSFFRGSEEDKLMRWKGAVEEYGIDYFVTFDADDLFCEPLLNEIALEQIVKENLDFIHSTKIIPGAFTYCINREALIKVCDIKDTTDTEMMWVFFLDTGLFKVAELNDKCLSDFYRPNIRITLDYYEDLLFFREVFKNSIKSKDFSLRDILYYLDKNPEISKINYFRDEEWKTNQNNRTSLKIKN